MFNEVALWSGALLLQVATLIIAYRGWSLAQALQELIRASPTNCMTCAQPQMGHETMMEMGQNLYMEPHPFIPVQMVYLPDIDPRSPGDVRST